jgi:hypothetical protein
MQTAASKSMSCRFLTGPACIECAIIFPIPAHLQILRCVLYITRGAAVEGDFCAAINVIWAKSEVGSRWIVANAD